MKCFRCGATNIFLHELTVTYFSGNKDSFDLCGKCIEDIENFIKLAPNYNIHGFNLDSYTQMKQCDTRENRGFLKEGDEE